MTIVMLTRLVCLVALVGQHVHKTNGKHAATMRITLDFTFHPIFIVCALIKHYQNLSFLELQFVVIIRITVVKCTTSSIARCLQEKIKELFIVFNMLPSMLTHIAAI